MAIALAQIGAAFDEAAVVNAFKLKVEHLLRLGPQHPAVRARFGARAAMLAGRGLDAAIVIAERWWRDERKAFQIASAFGCAPRLSLEVLRELRLILRLDALQADGGRSIPPSSSVGRSAGRAGSGMTVTEQAGAPLHAGPGGTTRM